MKIELANPELASLKRQAAEGLESYFGVSPQIFSMGPGRVNLIGEHIDYCDGFVLPFAIERVVVIAGRMNGTNQARIATSITDTPLLIDLTQPIKVSEPRWGNYIRGVLSGFQERGIWPISGFDASIVSSVPSGGGLSSSAALELAMATFLEAVADHILPTKEKALLCQQAEHEFAGVPCGIMDQFTSAFGQSDHLVLIDCQTQEPKMIPFDSTELTILVSNTKVSHNLSDGAYAARRQATERGLSVIGKSSWRDVTEADLDLIGDDEKLKRRCRHVVSEIQRTKDAVTALRAGEFPALGKLMSASHASLRDDFEVSCPELDFLVEMADQLGSTRGVVGTRMTGGGFGGSTVTLCQTDKAHDIANHLAKTYRCQFGVALEVFASRPASGARLI